MKTFIKFCGVGVLGFMVDTAVFSFCFSLLHIDLLLARIIAFIFAVNTTYTGNRFFTFQAQKYSQSKKEKVEEWCKFVFTACVSLIPNLLIFKGTIYFYGANVYIVYMAFVLGIAVATASNYFLSTKWVFAKKVNYV